MRRFTRSYRTRRNIIEASEIRDQFIRQLTKEAEALTKQLSEQFSEALQTQLAQGLQNISARDGAAPAAGVNEPGSIAGIGQLLATGARYLVNRPKTSRSTLESSRSIDANTKFKLSQSQAAGEMQSLLGHGDKNA